MYLLDLDLSIVPSKNYDTGDDFNFDINYS